jgi:hypothetical protein
MALYFAQLSLHTINQDPVSNLTGHVEKLMISKQCSYLICLYEMLRHMTDCIENVIVHMIFALPNPPLSMFIISGGAISIKAKSIYYFKHKIRVESEASI